MKILFSHILSFMYTWTNSIVLVIGICICIRIRLCWTKHSHERLFHIFSSFLSLSLLITLIKFLDQRLLVDFWRHWIMSIWEPKMIHKRLYQSPYDMSKSSANLYMEMTDNASINAFISSKRRWLMSIENATMSL